MSHPLIARAEQVAARLAPHAAGHELHGVKRATLDYLAAAGLHGVLGPEHITGTTPSAAVYREVAELLAGADGTTWFVWFQHHPVVKMLAANTNQELAQRWLPDLCAGTTQAGVAFSHLRSERLVMPAVRTEGGWNFSGTAPWCTGWGLLDLVLVGATTPDDEVVFALVPLVEGRGMSRGPDLGLAAMGGTHTAPLHLDDYLVTEADVVLRAPRATWAVADAAAGANVQPSTFGVARAAVAELAGMAGPQAEETAAALSARIEAVRRQAYALIDGAAPSEAIDDRLRLRAEALMLGVEATSALVAAMGGQAMTGDHPAQRWAREAMFHLVFAQTKDVRAATLTRLGS